MYSGCAIPVALFEATISRVWDRCKDVTVRQNLHTEQAEDNPLSSRRRADVALQRCIFAVFHLIGDEGITPVRHTFGPTTGCADSKSAAWAVYPAVKEIPRCVA